MSFFRRSRVAHVDPDPDLRLVVGLGNPGARYEGTRHNVGFMVVDRLAERYGGRFKGSKQRADTTRVNIDGMAVLLAKPITFMNDSGHAVRRLAEYYRLPAESLLVVYDEIDLPFGTLRMRPAGGSAGHRGLKSIITELGTENFPRLRVGVGRPAHSAVGHVLGPFERDEMARLPALIDVAADAVVAALRDGVLKAMNDYNRSYEGGPAASPS